MLYMTKTITKENIENLPEVQAYLDNDFPNTQSIMKLNVWTAVKNLDADATCTFMTMYPIRQISINLPNNAVDLQTIIIKKDVWN